MADSGDMVSEADEERLERVTRDLKSAERRYHTALSGANARGGLEGHQLPMVGRELKRISRVLRGQEPEEIERMTGRIDKLAAKLELSDKAEESQDAGHEQSRQGASSVEGVVADISEKQRASVAEKLQVVQAMGRGCSAQEAVDEVGVDRSAQWARRWNQRFLAHGVSGLQDRRRYNGPAATVLTPEIRRRIKSLYLGHPDMGVSAVHRVLSQALIAEGLSVPSYETVRRCVAEFEPFERMQMRTEYKPFEKNRLVGRALPVTQNGNDCWEVATARLNACVRILKDGEWVAGRVWIAVALDAHTHAIAGFVLRTRSITAWDLHGLLMHSIHPKPVSGWPVCGIPRIVQITQGAEEVSTNWRRALDSLGVRHDPYPADSPQEEGRIERWIRVLDADCVQTFSYPIRCGKSYPEVEEGISKLLTLERLNSEITHWIVNKYHLRHHSETGQAPARNWLKCTPIRLTSLVDLPSDVFPKGHATRRVTMTGIHLTVEGVARVYWATALGPHFGHDLTIRFNPEDLNVVWAFDLASGALIGEIPRLHLPSNLPERRNLRV